MPRKPSENKGPQSVEAASRGYHLTSGDMARMLHVDLKTIHNWVNQAHLRGRRTKGRHLRFERTEAVRFMRQYGYPIPVEVGAHPPNVVVDLADGSQLSSNRALKRGVHLSLAVGLYACALMIADGEQEIVVVDLDRRDTKQLKEFVAALRAWPLSQAITLIGVGNRRPTRRAFLALGGDLALPSGAESELRGVLAWLTGAADSCPESAEVPH